MTSVVTKTEFRARKGSRLTDTQAEKYGAELLRLHRVGLPLTPENVVKRANAQRSPLRDFFEWDDTVAAAEYRMVQARKMMASIDVVLKPATENESEQRARLLINVVNHIDTEDNGDVKQYIPLDVVLRTPELHDQMMAQAARELSWFRQKYSALSGLADVFTEIDRFLERAAD